MRALGRHAQSDGPVAQAQAGAQLELPRPAPRASVTPRPSGTTSIRAAGTPSSRTRSSRVLCASTTIRCERLRRERHEHAHARGCRSTGGLGKDLVDEVVDRHDPGEAPVQRRRTGERVHEIDAGAPGQAGKVLLLAAHALGAAASPARARRPSRPALRAASPAASRFTNAVKRMSRRSGGQQRRDQLARRDLHPPGLAGHEEDEVQADVGQCAGFSSARHTDVQGAP